VKKQIAARPEAAPAPALKVRMWWQPLLAAASLVGVLAAAWWFLHTLAPTPASIQLATAGQVLRDTFSDGSRVALNRNSGLTAEISGQQRRIKLRGEALFEVMPDAQKPFVVEVQALEIQALGTVFNVDNLTNTDEVIVSVQEGRVQVRMETQTEVLAAGQKAVYSQKTQKITVETTADPNVAAYSNRRLFFDSKPLSVVIPTLEKTYNVSIQLKNKNLESCLLYGKYNNESLENILDLLADTFSLTVTLNNGVYELSGGQCE
jgi:transmembrane sensor